MTTTNLDTPAIPRDRSVLDGLRQHLLSVGYTETGLLHALGSRLRLSVQGITEVLRRRLTGAGGLETLIRLFWLGVPVPHEEAQAALAPVDLGALVEARIVALDRGEAHSLITLNPHEGLLFASDPGRLVSGRRRDFVIGVTVSSNVLEWLTIRRNVSTALDLGSGCGVQALLASRHAGSVTAVDVNPRAIAYTEFNAALNGIVNVETELGTWFEPVENRRFDLVVANLPFVVSPDTTFDYRDSGLRGGSLSRIVVSQIPSHLTEGGFAHILCNWIVPAGADWREPLETWIEGTECDAVLMLHGREDPLSYAASWNQPLDEEDLPSFTETLDRWLAYYQREGIDEIAGGMVALRRRSGGRNFVRALEVPETPARPAGDHVDRLFEGHDLVRSLQNRAAILDLPLKPAEGAILDERWLLRDGRFERDRVRFGLRSSAGFSVSVNPRAASVLRRCDGRRPLRALVESVAETTTSVDVLASEVASEARRLVALGFLVLRDDGIAQVGRQ